MIPTDMPLGMDFLKQFWQQGAGQTAAAPSFATQPSPAFSQAMGQYMMPTFDLNELDKRMGDMRTVLQFMELNTQLLRQSLSTLEVQRNTLATLQSMANPAAPTAAPAAAQPQPQAQSHSHSQSQSQASDDANAASTSPWLAAWQSMVQATSQGAAAADRTDATAAPATVVPVKKTPAKKAATTVTAKVTTKTKAAASKTAASQKSPPAAPRKR